MFFQLALPPEKGLSSLPPSLQSSQRKTKSEIKNTVPKPKKKKKFASIIFIDHPG